MRTIRKIVIPLLIAVMASWCWLQAGPDDQAAEELEEATFGGDDELRDLNSIRGKPIKRLQIMGSETITDLSAVAGMKLENVVLWKTRIEDISPLAGMPIKNLIIFGGEVKDLTPLKGMPLESLQVGANRVTDLSPIEGLPLKELRLYSSQISDISPLAGMPLEILDLRVFDSGKITDLTPLEGMKLKSLDFHPNTITQGMEVIRHMKSLEEINRETPGKFWRKYDADAPARKRLRDMGINYHSLDVADDGTWSLGFYGDDLRDLSVLNGLPIDTLELQQSTIGDLSPLAGSMMTCLNLNSTAVKDLSPIRKIPLKTLYLFCPEVDDLSPLKGMRLETLYLTSPKLVDLSPLRGMSLNTLYISKTGVRDLTPLEGLPLEDLFVDIDHIEKGIMVLKRMKSLKRINNRDVEEVWKTETREN